ncbi:MAG: hypothetical protein ACOH5I_10260 [Oligoflexus sp.]
MNWFLTLHLSALLSANLALAEQKPAEFCRPLDYQAFQQLSQDWTEVVFFASWCASCRGHIESSDPESTIYVIAYDEPQAASRVLEALKPTAKLCLIDRDESIRKAFAVDALPAKIQRSGKD